MTEQEVAKKVVELVGGKENIFSKKFAKKIFPKLRKAEIGS